MKTVGINPVPFRTDFSILPARFRIFGQIRIRYGNRGARRPAVAPSSNPPISATVATCFSSCRRRPPVSSERETKENEREPPGRDALTLVERCRGGRRRRLARHGWCTSSVLPQQRDAARDGGVEGCAGGFRLLLRVLLLGEGRDAAAAGLIVLATGAPTVRQGTAPGVAVAVTSFFSSASSPRSVAFAAWRVLPRSSCAAEGIPVTRLSPAPGVVLAALLESPGPRSSSSRKRGILAGRGWPRSCTVDVGLLG